MKMVKCSVRFCTRNANTDMGISFFRFPAEAARCDEWMKALGRPDLQGINAEKLHQSKYRVCGVHFPSTGFSSMLLNRLKKEAIPVNFPFQARPGPYFDGDPKELEKYMRNSTGNNSTVVAENDQDSNEINVPDGENLLASENEDSKHSQGQTDEPLESEVPKPTDETSRDNDVDTPKENESSQSDETDSSASKENEICENKETENSNTAETEESQSADAEKSESPEPEKLRSAEAKRTSSSNNKKSGKSVNENGQTEILQNGDSQENAKDDERRMEMDEDDDDDFNPLLLCPDISMDVDEAPVLTGSTDMSATNDATDSNSLFAPLFSTFVDEMTGAEISFNLTSEEQQLRERLYGPNNPIQFTKIHCTACNVHLGSALAGQTNRFVHPLLKVLICKECYHFYTSGEFEKDEDGSELYCRWCGQGGQVLCCTMCEFVFCKKCIRINFGRKKLTQVRDSDDWKCFRCDMSQLKALRAMCVEFFEYIRKETARASTYTDSDAVNKDLTNCCPTQNRKRSAADSEKETEKETVKRPRRKKTADEDPDYNPHALDVDERSKSPVAGTSGVKAVASAAKTPVSIQPKQTTAVRSEVSFPGKSPSSTVRIGNTVINVKSLGTTPMPAGISSPTAAKNTAVRTPVPNIRPKPTFTPRTPQNAARPSVATVPVPGSLAQIRSTSVRTPIPSSSVMKHEWFEKTVRAAARVNSNLSYTLTQLNKAQSSASSVEQLAVVHNKLQEILSSSINSLIQIRKNLRTEFIAGIKTIRFPPKPTAVDDDDVIIVNSEPAKKTMVAPAPQVQKQVRSRMSTPVRASSSNTVTKSDSTPSKGYLKVRSFSQLQNVSSECITIPDDDPPPLVSIAPIVIELNEDVAKPKEDEENKDSSKTKDDDKTNENKDGEAKSKENQDEEKTEDDVEKEKTKDKEESVENDKSQETESKDEESEDKEGTDKECKDKDKEGKDKEDEKTEASNEKENGHSAGQTNGTKRKRDDGKSSEETEKCNGNTEDVTVKTEPEEDSYNVKEQPTPKIRRMLSVKVNLKKTTVVEDLVKKEPVEENGDN